MKARSTRISTHRDDGSRLSSSLPQPVLSQGTSRPSLLPNFAPPSPPFISRRRESALDESTLTRRTTAAAAQRQLRVNQRSLLRRLQAPKDNRNINGRLSTLASQPVLVRSYNPDETADTRQPIINMSAQQVDLPSVEEFGIEAILRAIEPDIRSTLDSIAEICGRSRLTLANEYGSHIAPFGEVHPFPGELLAIQENITNDTDGPADVDGRVVIVDDSNDLYGSPLGLLDDLRQTAIATGYPRTTGVETQETNSGQQNRRANVSKTGAETRPRVTSVARMEAFAATSSRPGSKALLGNVSAKAKAAKSTTTMASPALLSETRLDAKGNRSSWPSEPPDTPRGSPMLPASSFTEDRNVRNRSKVDRTSLVADVQDWLSWLKMIVQREKTSQHSFHTQSHSAECSLRALLVRDQDQAVAIPTA